MPYGGAEFTQMKRLETRMEMKSPSVRPNDHLCCGQVELDNLAQHGAAHQQEQP